MGLYRAVAVHGRPEGVEAMPMAVPAVAAIGHW